MTRKIRFLATFVDSNGIAHNAIHVYDTITGFVDMMKDYKFDGLKYPSSNVLDEKYDNCKRYVVDYSQSKNHFIVIDTLEDQVIASFYSKKDAKDFATYKNDESRYVLDANDPWN